jgi:hypothetical protein
LRRERTDGKMREQRREWRMEYDKEREESEEMES